MFMDKFIDSPLAQILKTDGVFGEGVWSSYFTHSTFHLKK